MLFLREHQPKQNPLAFLHITLQDITKCGALSTCPSHDDKNDSRKLRLSRGMVVVDGVPEESSVTEWLTDRPTSCGDQPKMCSWPQSGLPPMDWSRSALNNIILAISDWSHLSNRLICLFTAHGRQVPTTELSLMPVLFLTRSHWRIRSARSIYFYNSSESFDGSFFSAIELAFFTAVAYLLREWTKIINWRVATHRGSW